MTLLLSFVGCKEVPMNHDINYELTEAVSAYIETNDLKSLTGTNTDSEEVTAYKSDTGYGLLIASQEDSKDEIVIKDIPIDAEAFGEDDILLYRQVKGEKHAYIGLFIKDEDFVKKTDAIYVGFSHAKSGEVSAVQQTSNGQSACIITYLNQKDIRKISEIRLMDKGGQTLYSKTYE